MAREAAFDGAGRCKSRRPSSCKKALLLSTIEEHRAKIASADSEITRQRASPRGRVESGYAEDHKDDFRSCASAPICANELAEKGPQLQTAGPGASTAACGGAGNRDSWFFATGTTNWAPPIESLETSGGPRPSPNSSAPYPRSLPTPERKVATTNQQLIKAQQRHGVPKTLTAPIRRCVVSTSAPIHTIGGVVTPAQRPSWSWCPRTTVSRSRRRIENKENRLRPPRNQSVEVKLETFSISRAYGHGFPGYVRSGIEGRRPGRKNSALYFPVRIALSRNSMNGRRGG